MKIIRAIIFLSCLISSSFASELSWGELPLDDEFASSSRDGKPTLVFVHASWCSYCHKLKDEVFTDSRVKDKMNEYHLVSRCLVKRDSNRRSIHQKIYIFEHYQN